MGRGVGACVREWEGGVWVSPMDSALLLPWGRPAVDPRAAVLRARCNALKEPLLRRMHPRAMADDTHLPSEAGGRSCIHLSPGNTNVRWRLEVQKVIIR